MRTWLLKTEPSEFSFDDLWKAKGRRTGWDGVRNYQARNFMTRDMQPGDRVLIYHSSSDPTGIAGWAEVASAAYPDPTQFERGHVHFDAKSKREAPLWFQVDVRALEPLPRLLKLEELKANPKLAGLELLRRGSRLSIQPVSAAHAAEIERMIDALGPA